MAKFENRKKDPKGPEPFGISEEYARLMTQRLEFEGRRSEALLGWQRWSVCIALGLLVALTLVVGSVIFLTGFGAMHLPDNVVLAIAVTLSVQIVGITGTIITGLWKARADERQ